MSTTITLGKSGRLVLPKVIRDMLGLREGARLRIEAADGKFEAIPETESVRIEMRGGFPVILGGPARRKGDIVRAVKASREERDNRAADQRSRK